ncbi:MAG: flavodoxin family protein [Candidatus Micrarchaeota archaeon]
MRIIGIGGSPRDGNSDRMLEEAIRGAISGGADVKSSHLRKIRWRGCCGRDECFYDRNCIIKDQMSDLMKEVEDADGIILASPSYFNNVSGLMKDFMDRTNPYCRDRTWKGKKAVLLSVGGANERSVKRCAGIMKEFLGIHGITVVGAICAKAEKPGEIAPEKLAECFDAGRRLAASKKP